MSAEYRAWQARSVELTATVKSGLEAGKKSPPHLLFNIRMENKVSYKFKSSVKTVHLCDHCGYGLPEETPEERLNKLITERGINLDKWYALDDKETVLDYVRGIIKLEKFIIDVLEDK